MCCAPARFEQHRHVLTTLSAVRRTPIDENSRRSLQNVHADSSTGRHEGVGRRRRAGHCWGRDVDSELRSIGEDGDVNAVSIDLTTPGGPQTLVAEAEKFGGLDIVVNNLVCRLLLEKKKNT